MCNELDVSIKEFSTTFRQIKMELLRTISNIESHIDLIAETFNEIRQLVLRIDSIDNKALAYIFISNEIDIKQHYLSKLILEYENLVHEYDCMKEELKEVRDYIHKISNYEIVFNICNNELPDFKEINNLALEIDKRLAEKFIERFGSF